jgi:hypothetical protein
MYTLSKFTGTTPPLSNENNNNNNNNNRGSFGLFGALVENNTNNNSTTPTNPVATGGFSLFGALIQNNANNIITPPTIPVSKGGFGLFGDGFHFIIKKISTPIAHFHAKAFARAMSSAIYRWRDVGLYNRLCSNLISKGLDPAQVLLNDFGYFAKRCPRFIPGPEELEKSLKEVFNFFELAVCPITGKVFFNEKAKADARNVLKLVKDGAISDNPDIEYSVLTGYDIDGFALYDCFRGTNALENVHLQICRFMGLRAFVMGHVVGEAMLQQFVHRHNWGVRVRHIPGYANPGHFDGQKMDYLQELHFRLFHIPLYSLWVPANNHDSVGQLVGIIPRKVEVNEVHFDEDYLFHVLASDMSTSMQILSRKTAAVNRDLEPLLPSPPSDSSMSSC